MKLYLRRTRDVARIAVVTILLRCYYFEFVVLFTYFLKRFCIVAVFISLSNSVSQSVKIIMKLMFSALDIYMLSIYFIAMMTFHCVYQRVNWNRRMMKGCLIFQVGIL